MLQSVIEQFGAICPIHIIGDLNAQLPKRRLLHRRWYRLPGFNTHSSILYDLINDNDLCVADFTDPQHVQYTYFCDSTATCTWIDHCLTTSQNIVSCNIIPRHADNISDHLPLCLQTRVFSEQCQPAVLSTDVPLGVTCRWDNLECTNTYRDILHSKLSTMYILTCDANVKDGLETLDPRITNLYSYRITKKKTLPTIRSQDKMCTMVHKWDTARTQVKSNHAATRKTCVPASTAAIQVPNPSRATQIPHS